MKKIIVCLLFGTIIISLLTGCMDLDTEVTDGSGNEYTEGIMSIKVMDMDQNEVLMGDLISQNKVTMINFWATYCGPCLGEMPGLGELERKYKDQGFEILGMTCDIVDYYGNVDKDLVDEALSLKKDTGITYPIFIAGPEIKTYENIEVFPTTVFYDSDGNALANPIYGMQSEEEWERIISSVLQMTDKE